MKCTKCGGEFRSRELKGVKIDQCQTCKSMWLDFNELDQLEDTVWDQDELKGSLFFGDQPSPIHCPKCGTLMKKINYRFYDLELEICPKSCGIYLDAGEEKRILEIMENEKDDDKRKIRSEEQWENTISRMRTKSFFDRLKKFMGNK